MPADPVTVAYIHDTEVAHSWHHSMMQMIGWDMSHHGRLMRGGWVRVKGATDGLSKSRNQAIKQFLDEPQNEWLFWIDTDMGFAPDTVDRLMEIADPEKAPVVGALCFAYPDLVDDGMGGGRAIPRPTLFDWTEHNAQGTRGFVGWSTYPVNTVVRCAGTGSACILIHRSVLEKIREKFGEVWYDRVETPESTTNNKYIGEDLAFCMRVGAVGAPLLVHTGVRTTHLKPIWVSEQDFWTDEVTQPATEEVAVIVPVMKRPGNAAPFMRSLRASTGLATVYAVYDGEDSLTAAAWRKAGADLLKVNNYRDLDRPGTFAEKVNAGYRATSEPWIFIVGDDVSFHPGWLDSAQSIAGDRYHVIGTNDLGNPRVLNGEHATHLLLRRSYVASQGASWDGPGIVAHEGYRHWFVDDEIVTAAKVRGAWAMALGSLVEHYHPAWNKAPMDHIYKLGMESAEDDRKVFEDRCKKHLDS